jgi:ABC-type nitrate/sulfonate/bicarbonate transport system substrate-binding protein
VGFYTLPGSNVHSARDLIGKQVAMNTLGAHAEFVLREYLVRGGLTPEEIKQVTMLVLPPVNCEQALRAKQVDLVSITTMLRDKASARGELRMLFSDYQLYGPFNAGSFVMTKKFLAANPRTVRKFVQATSDALAWARAQSREAVVARMKQIIVKRKRLENTDAVQYWRSSGVSTPHAENTAHEHQMWIDWLVRDGQLRPGQVKPSDVFTNEFNSAAGELARAP